MSDGDMMRDFDGNMGPDEEWRREEVPLLPEGTKLPAATSQILILKDILFQLRFRRMNVHGGVYV